LDENDHVKDQDEGDSASQLQSLLDQATTESQKLASEEDSTRQLVETLRADLESAFRSLRPNRGSFSIHNNGDDRQPFRNMRQLELHHRDSQAYLPGRPPDQDEEADADIAAKIDAPLRPRNPKQSWTDKLAERRKRYHEDENFRQRRQQAQKKWYEANKEAKNRRHRERWRRRKEQECALASQMESSAGRLEQVP